MSPTDDQKLVEVPVARGIRGTVSGIYVAFRASGLRVTVEESAGELHFVAMSGRWWFRIVAGLFGGLLVGGLFFYLDSGDKLGIMRGLLTVLAGLTFLWLPSSYIVKGRVVDGNLSFHVKGKGFVARPSKLRDRLIYFLAEREQEQGL